MAAGFYPRSWDTTCVPGDWFSADRASDPDDSELPENDMDSIPVWPDIPPGEPGALSRVQGEDGLARLLIDRYESGRMSATDVCVISYWSSHAGATGFISQMAKPPGDPSTGHYSRHLRRVLNMKEVESQLLHITVPGHSRHDLSRCEYQVPVLPPHEAFAREFTENLDVHTLLAEHREKGLLPPIYEEHPIAVGSDYKALPVMLYVDGVPTTTKESMVGFWAYCPLTQLRHLLCLLRKSRLCRCGCQGWCSFYPVFAFLRWSFVTAAIGIYPMVGPDESEWDEPLDSERAGLAGAALPCQAAVVGIKGDWSELCHTWGFQDWQHAGCPCPNCGVRLKDWQDDSELNAFEYPWPLVTWKEYDDACKRCETHIILTAETYRSMKPFVNYDRSKGGALGLALTKDIPALGLIRGDRIEPSVALMNVDSFFALTEFPQEITMWRCSKETRCKHRNPLLDPVLGLGPDNILVDLLHCLFLGVLKEFASCLVWEMLMSNIYGARDNLPPDEKIKQNFERLAVELESWYVKWKRENPSEPVTEFGAFAQTMIGTQNKKALRLKASESKGFFFFLVSQVKDHSGRMRRGDIWKETAVTLMTLVRQLASNPLWFQTLWSRSCFRARASFLKK